MTATACERPVATAGPPRPLCVVDLGLVPYGEAVRLQDTLAEGRLAGSVPETLLLLEHPPVITLGRRASLDHVYVPEDQLARRGVALQRSTRGGLVTYHGPGQLVGYPIVRLRELGLRIPDYICGLQRTLIAALGEIGIRAYSHIEHVGVWTDRGKIAAVGVAQRHGVTLHGFAVNLQPDLDHFALINPCGIGDLGVTSAEVLLGRKVEMDDFKRRIATAFAAEFGFDLTWSAELPVAG